MTINVPEAVARLLTVATGEPYGDCDRVTGVCYGYAEPGYADSRHARDEPVIVFGNWNPTRFARDGEPPLTQQERLMPRLGDALERVGADIQWGDEWTECIECNRAVRTKSDSYHWKPSSTYVEGEGEVCWECQIGYGEQALEEYINDPNRAVTWCGPDHLEQYGYVKWEPGDEHTYENGWHPGQTDDPKEILEAIHAKHPDREVIFFLDENSQFYIRFSAYVREPNTEEE